MKKYETNTMTMEEIIQKNPLIAILRNIENEILPYYTEAILNGGIHAVEVAMNTPNGAEQIRLLHDKFGSDILLGAGTVITQERIFSSLNAGASFFLTPSVTEENLSTLCKSPIPVLPGVLSPSDVELCLRYGLHTMKLFPAASLPASYIKNLKGPFSDTQYVAVGGVSLANLPDIFKAGFVGAGIGSSLIPQQFLDNRDWKGAAEAVRRCCEVAQNV